MLRSFLSRRRLFGSWSLARIVATMPVSFTAASAAARDRSDVYRRLGVKPFINGVGKRTIVSGSLMAPEVRQAMDDASRSFVSLQEWMDRAGERIATLTGAESALVTAGACAAMAMGAAGAISGTDRQIIRRLPDTTGLRNEIIIQRSHNDERKAGGSRGYMRSLLVAGTKLVEVETREELEGAIGPRTLMLHFVNYCAPFSTISREDWAAIARKHKIPSMLDAAADFPPRARVGEYLKLYDLVAVSGGKGLLGPQCAGMLLGRKDLVKAAAMNMCPNVFTVGRGFKVGKEEVAGMVAAVERFYKIDEEAQRREWQRRVEEIQKALARLKGIRTEIRTPEIANVYPTLYVSWSIRELGFDCSKLGHKPVPHDPAMVIGGGEPGIAVQTQGDGSGFSVNSFNLQPGESTVVARRLRQVFERAIRDGAAKGA
jgi:D-glucosaminate-6-phosphate ammonia-lyase